MFNLNNIRFILTACQDLFIFLSEARKLSCIVARKLSGLQWSPMEVTNETDRDITGDLEDEI